MSFRCIEIVLILMTSVGLPVSFCSCSPWRSLFFSVHFPSSSSVCVLLYLIMIIDYVVLSYPFPDSSFTFSFLISSSIFDLSFPFDCCFFFLCPQITTDLRHRCTDNHTGTSASAPMAAAIIALALEAK